MIIYLLQVLLAAVSYFTITWLWARKDLYKVSLQTEGPRGLPFLGVAYKFHGHNNEMLKKLHALCSGYKGIFSFWAGHYLFVSSTNPEQVGKILSSSKFAYKQELYDIVIKPYIGNGLISASGETYKLHRRLIQPMFDLKFCVELLELFQTKINKSMEYLHEYIDKDTFDIHYINQKCFVDIVGESILGTKINAQEKGINAFARATSSMYNFGCTRLFRPWLHPNLIFALSGYKKIQDRIINDMHTFSKQVIADSWDRLKLNKSNENLNVIPVIDSINKHLEEDPSFIKDEDLIHHIITLYTAAEDTMTIIASFLAVAFGMYPEYQNKALEEVRRVVGEKPRLLSIDEINQLEYIDMCIKDILRLCPIAPYIMRQAKEDYYIDGQLIPKGCSIMVPIFNLHYDPEVWENPTHFHPDHFLPEKVEKRHHFSFVPFSAGPRGCIGKIFANLCLKTFTVNLLQNFEVETDGKFPDLKLRMDISVRPIEGYNLRLKKRVWS